MSQQPSPALPGKGDIIINGHVEGENIAIGPGAAVNVVKNYYQAKISDTQEQRLVAEIKAEVLAQIGLLNKAGFRPEVASPPRRAEQVATEDPFALPVGISPVPARIALADVQQWQQQIAPLDQRLRQLDQHLSAATPGERRVARELVVGQERVNLVELLIQQGNLAVWAFRQAAARLFADQVSAYYLAHPAWPNLPALQTFHAGALRALEVRRAWVLYQKYRIRHPELTGPYVAQLSQGRWRDVLQAWFSTKEITTEAFQYERAYLKAIGESYDPQAVRAAAQQAEACFAEALRRQPDNSVALVNWGAIKAETALFFSIESGAIDQARLAGAQALFQRAEGQLAQRQDREGQVALGMCLLHDATRLPPDANLGAVQWAAHRVQQMRQDFPQDAAQGAIQWEMVERNWARRDARFFDEQKIRRARQILAAAGAAALLFLCDEWLTAHAQMLQQIARWAGSGLGWPGQAGQPAGQPLQHALKPAQSLSRRAFLLRAGLAGGAVIVAGGAAAVAVRAGFLPNPFATVGPPTRTPSTPIPGTTLATHSQRGRVTSLAWSPGGSASLRSAISPASGPGGPRIASASQDGIVQVWDASSGNVVLTYSGHKGPVLAVSWSPNGRYIASADMNRLVQIWDANSGTTLTSYSGHDGAVYALAWSPNSQSIASGDVYGIVQVTGQKRGSLQPGGLHIIQALAWSPDGQNIIAGGGYFPGSRATNSANGPLAARSAAYAGLVVVWDAASGAQLISYSNHPQLVRAVACSPDSKLIVSGGNDATAQVWDKTSGATQLTYKNHNGPVNALNWSPNGQRIVSGSGDTTAQVWSASDGSRLLSYTKHKAAVNAVAWSPDGREIASGSDDQTAQVWGAS